MRDHRDSSTMLAGKNLMFYFGHMKLCVRGRTLHPAGLTNFLLKKVKAAAEVVYFFSEVPKIIVPNLVQAHEVSLSA